MIDLKVKCSICGKEESNKELIKEVADIVEKYDLKSEQYLTLLNVMSGKCLDSDEHSFLFDEEFLKEIVGITEKHKVDTAEIIKLEENEKTLLKELNELELKIKEVTSKINVNKDRIKNIQLEILIYLKEIEDSTGYSKIGNWYQT